MAYINLDASLLDKMGGPWWDFKYTPQTASVLLYRIWAQIWVHTDTPHKYTRQVALCWMCGKVIHWHYRKAYTINRLHNLQFLHRQARPYLGERRWCRSKVRGNVFNSNVFLENAVMRQDCRRNSVAEQTLEDHGCVKSGGLACY